ncbi:TolC family protein [Tautonia plasticadhaerens]|uniref:Outer membrane efflux protein n=1 Tax=Tautonia plasticadhaerens TaxID=2527974 RepID=A0A518H1M3_9BACT|nr:TolC family protein [Tautonia plasticadhaerens]QDV34738.1 Outer membrane efflux protein [Tautonia plasticadhaerens]
MRHRWRVGMGAALMLGGGGCALPSQAPQYAEVAANLRDAAIRPPHSIGPDEPMAAALDPAPAPPGLVGPRPVDDFIRRALAENRTVQAAYYNVMAQKHRIPQVTSLEDPVVSNTIYPSGSNGLQTAAGYVPWNVLVAQQFPWFGTLALRGEAAEQDVKVALAELATAQLDVVEAVKRAYADLYANERSAVILGQNRALVEDFIEIARIQYESGQTSQQDVLSAEVALADLDREFVGIRQGIESARADLAALMHVTPEAPLQTTLDPPAGDVPGQVDRLYRLAVASRPELRGRLAAVARDAAAVELAKKRSAPNVTLGFNYGLVSEDDALAPMANGNDNLGVFVGFNLPIYRRKVDGAILEAQARAVADAKLYDAERDGVYRELKDLLSRARAQRETLDLFRASILPRARDALDIALADYQAGGVDFLTLISAWREVLQIELQVALFEAELVKSVASLERAVGLQLRDHPPAPGAEHLPVGGSPDEAPPPPPGSGVGPGTEEDRVGDR